MRDDLVADLGEPCRLQCVDSAPPECDFGLVGTDRELEEEEAHERREWRLGKPPLVGRDVASLTGVRLVAEQPIDRILRVAAATQSCPERFRRDCVGHQVPAHHQGGIMMPELNAPHAGTRG